AIQKARKLQHGATWQARIGRSKLRMGRVGKGDVAGIVAIHEQVNVRAVSEDSGYVLIGYVDKRLGRRYGEVRGSAKLSAIHRDDERTRRRCGDAAIDQRCTRGGGSAERFGWLGGIVVVDPS